jgi:alcohol dehydrogenase class IV
MSQTKLCTSADGVKVGVNAPQIAASTIIYDSKFGLETPYELFSSTGFRALDHAMEIMYHPDVSEVARMMALQAASKLFTYLPKYKANPKDEATITQLQIACFTSLGFAGVGLKRPLGLSHTLGYALGSPYKIPHGKTSCLTLGHVIKLKAHDPAAAEQIARMAPFIGVSTAGSQQEIATAVGQKVLDLVKEMGLFSTLTDWKVGKDQVDIIVKRATGGTSSGPIYDAVANLVKGLY